MRHLPLLFLHGDLGLLFLCVCMHVGVQRDQGSLPWRMDSLGMAVRDGPMRQVCVAGSAWT